MNYMREFQTEEKVSAIEEVPEELIKRQVKMVNLLQERELEDLAQLVEEMSEDELVQFARLLSMTAEGWGSFQMIEEEAAEHVLGLLQDWLKEESSSRRQSIEGQLIDVLDEL